MNKNHQNATTPNPTTQTELWLPPSCTNDRASVAPAPKKKSIDSGFAEKSFWDWLLLLGTLLSAFGAIAIPVAIAIGATWFSYQQSQTAQQIANDQQQETTLKTYLDDMSDLLLNPNYKPDLRTSQSGAEIRQVAKERTLTTLRRLDAKRNQIVLRFLQDENLIGIPDAVIALSNADLSNDDLSGAKLSGTDLSGADLSGADLSGADLIGTILNGASLSGASLKGAILSNTFLNGTDLSGADLSGAELSGTDLSKADLSKAILSGTILNGADLSGATLSGATLRDAILIGADLSNTDLSNTDLSKASLGYADLSGADLSSTILNGADLSGVRNLTQQQLDEVYSCTNAILSTELICLRVTNSIRR